MCEPGNLVPRARFITKIELVCTMPTVAGYEDKRRLGELASGRRLLDDLGEVPRVSYVLSSKCDFVYSSMHHVWQM